MNLEDIKAIDFMEYSKIYKALLHKKKIEMQIEELKLELEEQERFVEKSLLKFKNLVKILVVITSKEKEEVIQVSNWTIPVNAQVKVCNIYGMPFMEACDKGVEMALEDGANFIFFLNNGLIMPINILQTVLDMGLDCETLISDYKMFGYMFASTNIFSNIKFSENFAELVVAKGYKILLCNFGVEPINNVI